MGTIVWKLKHYFGLARQRRTNLVDRREFGDSRGSRRGKHGVFSGAWGV